MIKFLLFLLLGLHLIRSIFVGFIQFFLKSNGQKRTPESAPPQSNTKKEPNFKNVGEYIDYEEID